MAFSIRQGADPATALLGRLQFVGLEFRQSCNELLSEGSDCIVVSWIWNVGRQFEIWLVLAFLSSKHPIDQVNARVFDQAESIGADWT